MLTICWKRKATWGTTNDNQFWKIWSPSVPQKRSYVNREQIPLTPAKSVGWQSIWLSWAGGKPMNCADVSLTRIWVRGLNKAKLFWKTSLKHAKKGIPTKTEPNTSSPPCSNRILGPLVLGSANRPALSFHPAESFQIPTVFTWVFSQKTRFWPKKTWFVWSTEKPIGNHFHLWKIFFSRSLVSSFAVQEVWAGYHVTEETTLSGCLSGRRVSFSQFFNSWGLVLADENGNRPNKRRCGQKSVISVILGVGVDVTTDFGE